MNIKSTPVRDFGNFRLDVSKIDLHSTSKYKIHLPYSGALPDELSNATKATIAITITVGLSVNSLLLVEMDGKQHRYLIEATPKEIDAILFPFFFNEQGSTRWDTGLDRYNMGLWQGSYVNWRRIVLEENGLVDLLFRVGPATTERVLQHIRHSETA